MKVPAFVLLFVLLLAVAVFAQGENDKAEDVSKMSAVNLKSIVSSPHQPRSCLGSSCNAACVYYGYLGGFCYSGDCWCFY
ncbi:hypothetical protein NQ318_020611 [Aromia moschata]|uniref:Defensin n=1 Tax=Aromia moschata TaxID=1265417 RepID=A0AAV8Z0P1_9CUCU|nr:hypothetical protein NQ318_020611 [Aromia moschata]